MGWRPVVREKFGDAVDRMGADACERVFEPGERLYSGPLAGSHEAAQHGRRFAALVAAKEGPVAAANRDPADGPLGRVVVDLQVAVVTVAVQRRPIL